MDPKEQLEQWVDQYLDRMTHLAYTYVRDWAKAEDVVQETFIRAYRSMAKFEPPASRRLQVCGQSVLSANDSKKHGVD